jgi:hypothetical protein
MLFAAPLVLGLIYIAVGRWQVTRLFGGGENLRLLRDATRVEAYRLAPPIGKNPRQERTAPREFQVVSSPVVVPHDLVVALAERLTSPSSYRFSVNKECGYPDYGVRLSFTKDGRSVDLFLCFHCRDLAVVQDGVMIGEADFDRTAAELIGAGKTLFPDDEQIQQLR